MHIIKNIQNFLLDQKYYVDIYNDNIHVYQYITLLSLSEKEIKLKLKEFDILIEGENLTILTMDNHEILIKGIINAVRFLR